MWTIGVVGLAVLGVTLAGTAAGAKPGKAGTGAGNCVIELAPGSKKALSTTCFDGFSEAVSFATQGRVTDAAAAGAGLDRQIQESNDAASVSPNAVFVLSVEYFDLAGFGPALVFIGAVQCTAATNVPDYEFVLAQADWDQISSYSTSYCLVNHFFLQNFTSANTGNTWCSTRICPIALMQPGNIPGDNNTRALRWT
jgi:hypothetical protein